MSIFDTLPTELFVIIASYSTFQDIHQLFILNPRVNTPSTLTSIIYEKYPTRGKDMLTIFNKSKLNLQSVFDKLNDTDIDLGVDTLISITLDKIDPSGVPNRNNLNDCIIGMISIKYKFPYVYKIIIDDNINYRDYVYNSLKSTQNPTFIHLITHKFINTSGGDVCVYLETGKLPFTLIHITLLLCYTEHPKIVFDVVNNPNFDIRALDTNSKEFKALISIIINILKYDLELFDRYVMKIKEDYPDMLKYFK